MLVIYQSLNALSDVFLTGGFFFQADNEFLGKQNPDLYRTVDSCKALPRRRILCVPKACLDDLRNPAVKSPAASFFLFSPRGHTSSLNRVVLALWGHDRLTILARRGWHQFFR
jgi:hypothetical protein